MLELQITIDSWASISERLATLVHRPRSRVYQLQAQAPHAPLAGAA